MDVTCYEIGDICYYVTHMQNEVLKKFEGEKKDKMIKRTAFTHGKLGEPIKGPLGQLAIVWPEGKAPGTAEIPADAKTEGSDEGSEAEVSGVHL